MFNGGWAVLMKRFAVPPVAFCDSGDTDVMTFVKSVMNIHANAMPVINKKNQYF